MIDVVDTLQRIAAEAESIGCQCPEGAACSVCEIAFLAREALEQIEADSEAVRQLFKESEKMLVLSRKKNETIMIGDNIVVTVVDIRGDKVRIGIEAPKEVAVHRSEVFRAIEREHGRGGIGPNTA